MMHYVLLSKPCSVQVIIDCIAEGDLGTKVPVKALHELIWTASTGDKKCLLYDPKDPIHTDGERSGMKKNLVIHESLLKKIELLEELAQKKRCTILGDIEAIHDSDISQTTLLQIYEEVVLIGKRNSLAVIETNQGQRLRVKFSELEELDPAFAHRERVAV